MHKRDVSNSTVVLESREAASRVDGIEEHSSVIITPSGNNQKGTRTSCLISLFRFDPAATLVDRRGPPRASSAIKPVCPNSDDWPAVREENSFRLLVAALLVRNTSLIALPLSHQVSLSRE